MKKIHLEFPQSLKTKQILIIGANRYLNKEFIIQQLLEQTIKEYNKNQYRCKIGCKENL